MFTSVKSPLLPFLSGTLLYSASILAQVTPVPNQDYSVIDRGQDFAVYRRTPMLTNDTGLVGAQTNEFTVLDHGMNYLQNGEWHESQDLVESFADGAIARYGAYQTIFSPDLNSEAVFDISTPDSQRIRGGVRAIQLTDVANGKSAVVATVKKSAPGEIIPPNNVIYRSAFDGLEADVLYVWKHNAFSQNVISRSWTTADGS